LKPPAKFVSMYVLRAGFLDGAAGVIVAVLAAMSVAAKYARLWELQRRGLGTGDWARGNVEHAATESPPASDTAARAR
jgi:hypothetical protein